MVKRPLLSLVMIVKDEASNIKVTLESVKQYVDRWTIVDTGSTDGTQKIVQEVMNGVPGQFIEEPFVDFATTRNFALDEDARQRHGRAIFTLFLGGDEVLSGGQQLRKELERRRDASDGAYCVAMRSTNKRWPYPRVLRTDAKWRYKGVVHEVPMSPGEDLRDVPPVLAGVEITHTPSDPERRVRRLREYDLPKLLVIAEDQSRSLVDRARAIFFLAETHANLAAWCGEDLGSPRYTHYLAAMSYYFRYALIVESEATSDEEKRKAIEAYFMYFHVADKAGIYGSQEILPRVQALVQAWPDAPGPWYLVAEHAARLDPQQGLSFAVKAAEVARRAKEERPADVVDDRFEWSALVIATDCARRLEQNDKARVIAQRALDRGAPKEMLEAILEGGK
jgi:glycosyltransferase involved in cell wall biosynthesis